MIAHQRTERVTNIHTYIFTQNTCFFGAIHRYLKNMHSFVHGSQLLQLNGMVCFRTDLKSNCMWAANKALTYKCNMGQLIWFCMVIVKGDLIDIIKDTSELDGFHVPWCQAKLDEFSCLCESALCSYVFQW